MKKFLATSLFFTVGMFAESWTGTIVDTACKTKDLASHTKQCTMGCASKGLGIVMSDGKFVKFDEAGNAKAVEALKASTKEKDLKGKVTGKLDGETIKVEKVEIL
jgi:hypothetical protein